MTHIICYLYLYAYNYSGGAHAGLAVHIHILAATTITDIPSGGVLLDLLRTYHMYSVPYILYTILCPIYLILGR